MRSVISVDGKTPILHLDANIFSPSTMTNVEYGVDSNLTINTYGLGTNNVVLLASTSTLYKIGR